MNKAMEALEKISNYSHTERDDYGHGTEYRLDDWLDEELEIIKQALSRPTAEDVLEMVEAELEEVLTLAQGSEKRGLLEFQKIYMYQHVKCNQIIAKIKEMLK